MLEPVKLEMEELSVKLCGTAATGAVFIDAVYPLPFPSRSLGLNLKSPDESSSRSSSISSGIARERVSSMHPMMAAQRAAAPA